MTPLYFLNESEVKIDQGEIYAKLFFGKYVLCASVSYLIFFVLALAFSGMFGFSVLIGALAAVGVPATGHFLLKREIGKINADRRQPHKVFSDIIDWEEGDRIELAHFRIRRLEYVGVTDDYRVVFGKRKTLTPLISERRTGKEKYKEIFTIPPLYLRRYTEENRDLEKRMTEKRKEEIFENKGTYQEYLETVSQEKKKLNG